VLGSNFSPNSTVVMGPCPADQPPSRDSARFDDGRRRRSPDSTSSGEQRRRLHGDDDHAPNLQALNGDRLRCRSGAALIATDFLAFFDPHAAPVFATAAPTPPPHHRGVAAGVHRYGPIPLAVIAFGMIGVGLALVLFERRGRRRRIV
jgi:hypothetical protein